MGAELATKLMDLCKARKMMIATAESCTGGKIAALLTDIPGSSGMFDRGFVTYSNEAKHEMLGVPNALIDEHGAVSEPVAIAMAKGALVHSQAQLSVSVTGIAGPGGGSERKPVGLVYIAVATKGGEVRCKQFHFSGNRDEIRLAARDRALEMLHDSACQA